MKNKQIVIVGGVAAGASAAALAVQTPQTLKVMLALASGIRAHFDPRTPAKLPTA